MVSWSKNSIWNKGLNIYCFCNSAFLDKPEDEETPRDKEPKIYNKRVNMIENCSFKC